LGAGDQGLMFGCASSQTPELTPLPIALAHRLAQKLEEVRHTESGSPLKPDGKTQVTVEYDEKNVPQRIHTILVSTQHSTEIGLEELTELVKSKIIRQTLAEIGKESLLDDKTIFLVNPSGSFTQGGPVADSGMTGRKLVVDSYGGWNRIGGGAFSGKDPTKVDRSAAYMARYIAKWIVSQEWAKECELQLSYAIGQAAPVSLDLFGDFKKPVSEVKQEITKRFNLKPKGIIEFLNLQTPIYLPTAAYGHFGRLPEGDFFSWEQVKT
jgi:S-adenosylmethionine synthetase